MPAEPDLFRQFIEKNISVTGCSLKVNGYTMNGFNSLII